MANKVSATGTYSGEELEVTFTALMVPDYIGDASVPNGTVDFYSVDPGSIEVSSLEILGVTIHFDKLPDELQAAIFALSDELDFAYDGGLDG